MTSPGLSFSANSLRVEHPGCVALTDSNLHIAAGEIVAFVGPSGAGKTTLLSVLAGILRPNSGAAAVDGKGWGDRSAADKKRVRSRIGFVHQDLALVPNLRALQNVTSGAVGRRSLLGSLRDVYWPSQATARRAFEILERVGIGDKAYQRTDRLSGGERQRVAIARALFQDPAALFADEPVSSVDPARARNMIDLLVSVSSERSLTLCVSLHDVELARSCFPRLIGMRDGRIVFDAAPSVVTDDDVAALYRIPQPANDRAPSQR